MNQSPRRVRVFEVGPRDGLQSESKIVETIDKIRLVEMLVDAGTHDIEVSSFVHPRRVPQLADAEAVFTGLRRRDGARFWALVPNGKGFERALALRDKGNGPLDGIAFFTAASETFTQNNIGMTIGESLDEFRAMMPAARSAGVAIRAYVSTSFVCPYEGVIGPAMVIPVVAELVQMGVDEVSLADTNGQSTPEMVQELLEAVTNVLPCKRTALHFHDTNGRALDNVRTALNFGITTFDSSAGGLGGCPFAPGAPGNLATEQLIRLLDAMGIETGIVADKVGEASEFIRRQLR